MKVEVRGDEMFRAHIARIATLVGYDVPDEDIVARCAGDGDPKSVTARWVAFMAREIRAGRYTVR